MRTNLSKAFAKLRRMGYIAKQNYWCCNTCAGNGVANIMSGMIDAGKPKKDIRGCVFYHHQNTQDLKEGHDLYVAYGIVGTAEHGDVGLSNEEQGKEIVMVLESYGMKTVWNGDGATKILVKAESIK